jgi:arylsulfatase A-like enzyme
MHQRVTLINYPEFDWPVGHIYGGQEAPGKVITLMRTFDRDLGQIEDAYRKAGILRKTLFVITADHGMASLGRFVSQDIVNRAIATAHTTAPAISWSNGAYVWLRDASKAPVVAKGILASRDPGIQSVYYLSGTGKRASYRRAGGWYASRSVDAAEQYLLKTLLNGHEPTIVVLCRNHATFAPTSTHWKADHGGASWQSQHIPLILAGPGIRAHAVDNQPALLIDVAPTALADMGVAPRGMEGNILTDALAVPGRTASRARAGEVRSIGPIVDALLAQERYEETHRW